MEIYPDPLANANPGFNSTRNQAKKIRAGHKGPPGNPAEPERTVIFLVEDYFVAPTVLLGLILGLLSVFDLSLLFF